MLKLVPSTFERFIRSIIYFLYFPCLKMNLEIVFHWRFSSIEGCLPYYVVFHQCLYSFKVFFHGRLYSIERRLPSKVIFHLRWQWQTIIWMGPKNVYFQKYFKSKKKKIPKKFWAQKILGPKKNQLDLSDLTFLSLTWLVPNWLDLFRLNLTRSTLT